MVNLHYLGIHGGDEFKANIVQNAAYHTLKPYIQYLRAFENRLKEAAPSIDIEPTQGDELGDLVRLLPPEDESPETARLLAQFLEAWEVTDDVPSRHPKAITVQNVDEEESVLELSHRPKGPKLWLRPNTTTIWRAIEAINRLMEHPSKDAAPLLKLVQDAKFVSWPPVEPADISDWTMLDDGYPGVEDQRAFVRTALGTPDFAFLEGPPGAGKTQAICELIVQAARRGQRVLLAASTHVAVDNVLEKLSTQGILDRDVIGVRIGRESAVSEAVQQHRLDKMVDEFRRQSVAAIDAIKDPTASQREFRAVLRDPTDTTALERLLLSSVNLVCGTTVGILQHPDIRNGTSSAPQFDLLIIDEASKTTFAEFLVPAMHAKRWVLVGDIRQLSPFVDPGEVAASLRELVNDARFHAIEAAIQAMDQNQPGPIIVPVKDDAATTCVTAECEARHVSVGAANDPLAMWTADVVTTPMDQVITAVEQGPPSASPITGEISDLIQRRRNWRRRQPNAPRPARCLEPTETWADSISWRLHRIFELRHDLGATEPYEEQIHARIPQALEPKEQHQVATLLRELPRLGYPSVLEALQRGYGSDGHHDPALRAGLPHEALAARHVALRFQHRMHPDISNFPRKTFYSDADLLQDPPDQAQKREWKYRKSRSVWINVPPSQQSGNLHPGEVKAAIDELKRFRQWAAANPKENGKWSVCVLTFYRGQEKELRIPIRRMFGDGFSRFSDAAVTVSLGTVDRFQGREADLVILSMVRPGWKPGFLDSPNRLNVALTRARYGLVIVGDNASMSKCKVPMLQDLARSTPRFAAFDLGGSE